jgi:hypothetical protein
MVPIYPKLRIFWLYFTDPTAPPQGFTLWLPKSKHTEGAFESLQQTSTFGSRTF